MISNGYVNFYEQGEMMKKEIESFIKDLKANKKLSSFDEASTKQAVVLRVLSFLGWDIFDVDEVYPNYSTNSHGVSYALRVRNTNKLFIEVKRVHEKLDSHQKRLVNLATREDVGLSILTNGIVWWFYLTSEKCDWQQKWFYSVDLLKQKTRCLRAQSHRFAEQTKSRQRSVIARGQSSVSG